VLSSFTSKESINKQTQAAAILRAKVGWSYEMKLRVAFDSLGARPGFDCGARLNVACAPDEQLHVQIYIFFFFALPVKRGDPA
jgi:hypothetical protein